MPIDGADFGKSRGCYGKAFSMARNGADEAAIADCILKGVEREIKWDGGAPAFRPVVELLVIVTGSQAGREMLLSGADTIKGNITGRATLGDLATRMRNCSTKGLPARAPKTAPLAHTAEGMDEEL